MPVSLSGITDRYNSAYGYKATKILARLSNLGIIKPSGYMNLHRYDPVDSAYAEMIFESSHDGDVYRFGVDELEKGSPALPFRDRKPDERLYIAPPPMVSFSREKLVNVTAIDNHPQGCEVIEDFGMRPYRIRMQGILIDSVERQAPIVLMQAVHKMFEAPGTYKVSGDLFHFLGITEVFFNSNFAIDFVEGYVDTIKFSVNAVAVSPAEFFIR
jgi:hypothetical protein